MPGKKEFGDYQTPKDFAEKICRFLKEKKGVTPNTVLEPTCGIGNFLSSSLLFDAEKYYGAEIDPSYCAACRDTIQDERVQVIQQNFFELDLSAFRGDGLLVLGNPPWVNNSTLSVLNSNNVPEKENFKKLKGLDALTGASNFDICESIILKLISAYQGTDTMVAMLCKTSVARNVFQELKRANISFRFCDMVEFDAQSVFHISASACLLLVQLTEQSEQPGYFSVYSLETPEKTREILFYQNGHLRCQGIAHAEDFEGNCCFTWRQGVKHDCAKVMELRDQNGQLLNGEKEIVAIEPDLVFPLIKSSMFKRPILDTFTKYVIVTQKKVREDTAYLAHKLPLTWAYLQKHSAWFERRKSTIYRGAPRFSMFGVGEYTYAPYKVGISGFYKEPLFSLLCSQDHRPVMTDDTSYFICLPTYDTAYTAMLYLNAEPVQRFLKRIAFLDAKRPYTKKVLERLDFSKICEMVGLEALQATEIRLGLQPYVTHEMSEQFSRLPEMAQQQLRLDA